MALCRTSRVISIGLFVDYEKTIILFGHERACPFILTINSQQRLSYKFNLLSHLNYNFLTIFIKHQSTSIIVLIDHFHRGFQPELLKQNTHLLLTVRFNHLASMSSVKNETVSSNENWKKEGGKAKRGKPVGRREVLEKHKAIGIDAIECGNRKQIEDDARESHEESFKEAKGKVRKSHESRREADYESQPFEDEIGLWDIIECELCFRTMDCSICKKR